MSIIGTFPTTINNGDLEDATVVMALLSFIQAQTNSNACPATSGTPILKGNGAGGTTGATPGVDYALPGATGADGRYPIYAGVAGGVADALTATINPCGISVLYDGMLITLDATLANATTTPTLNLTLGSTASGVLPIVKYNLVPVSPDDIIGAGHRLILGWNTGANSWVLLNPGTVTVNSIVGFTDGRYPIFVGNAGGSADAITATINPCGIAALYDGMLVSLNAASANATATPTFNLTLGSTATGVHIIEKDAASVLIAGDIAGLGHRILLAWNAGLGRWMLVNPKQPVIPGARAWADVTSTRTNNATISNTSGKEIMVSVTSTTSGGGTFAIAYGSTSIGGSLFNVAAQGSAAGDSCNVCFPVPNQTDYKVWCGGGGSGIAVWAECR